MQCVLPCILLNITAVYRGCINRRKLEACIDNGVKYATNAGMYVIIDWHILSDETLSKIRKKL